MKPVAIIVAVPREALLLEQALAGASLVAGSVFPTVQGALGSLQVVVCVGGVGKINAAAASASLIERHRPRLVINTGCAGAYPGSGLSIGDLGLAECEILGDEGAITSAGWLDLQQMKLPCLEEGEERLYNEIPLSVTAVEEAMQLAGRCGLNLARGRFVTLSTCSGTLQRGEELARRFGAIAENMEGAAVALTCRRYGIDCLEIRGISNLVEERNMAAWDIGRAVEAAQGFVLRYLQEMVKI